MVLTAAELQKWLLAIIVLMVVLIEHVRPTQIVIPKIPPQHQLDYQINLQHQLHSELQHQLEHQHQHQSQPIPLHLQIIPPPPRFSGIN